MNYILKLWMPRTYVFRSYIFEKKNVKFFLLDYQFKKNSLIRENERVLRILVLFIWFAIKSQNLSAHQKTRKNERKLLFINLSFFWITTITHWISDSMSLYARFVINTKYVLSKNIFSSTYIITWIYKINHAKSTFRQITRLSLFMLLVMITMLINKRWAKRVDYDPCKFCNFHVRCFVYTFLHTHTKTILFVLYSLSE